MPCMLVSMAALAILAVSSTSVRSLPNKVLWAVLLHRLRWFAIRIGYWLEFYSRDAKLDIVGLKLDIESTNFMYPNPRLFRGVLLP